MDIPKSFGHGAWSIFVFPNKIKKKDSPLKNTYAEFLNFFNSNNIKLSTNLTDAIDAMNIFKRYVYEKSLK